MNNDSKYFWSFWLNNTLYFKIYIYNECYFENVCDNCNFGNVLDKCVSQFYNPKHLVLTPCPFLSGKKKCRFEESS